MKPVENELSEIDRELFSLMEGNYISDEERVFFEQMKYKEQYDNETEQDNIMLPEVNDDKLLIYRNFYFWFYVDRMGWHQEYYEYDSLAKMLEAPLSNWGLGEGTILDWLRRRNYKGVTYDMCLSKK